MVPIVAFLSFLQRQQSQVERIMGAVYMAFMVSARHVQQVGAPLRP